MEISEIIRLFLVGICLFSIIFFVLGLAKVDWNTDVEEVLKLYKNELERTKKKLELGNKKINETEKEIFIYKKKLARKRLTK